MPSFVTIIWFIFKHSHRYLTLLNDLGYHQNLRLRISVNILFSCAENRLPQRNHHKMLWSIID